MKFIYLFTFLLVSFSSFSQPIKEENARIVAKNFFKAKYIDNNYYKNATQVNSTKGEVLNTFVKTYNGHNSYYVINFISGGWVIVAAHRARGPILAHSPKGEIKEYDMPEVFWDWMEQYEILIDSAYIQDWEDKEKEKKWKQLEGNLKSTITIKAAGTYLMTSEWGQSETNDYECPINGAYNFFVDKSNSSCCEGSGGKCAAGCGPVAMAQIMNYWKYSSGDGADFDWWDMQDKLNYYIPGTNTVNPNYEKERNAIAYLIKRCGDKLDVDYCDEGCASSTIPSPLFDDIIQAFVDFGYDEGSMNYERKTWHTYDQWRRMLKVEIDNGRPVFYETKTHVLVCHGHDGDNTFWWSIGWNGDGDGWYDFEDLFFDENGTNWHHCLIGLKPSITTNYYLKNVSINSGSNKTYQAKSDILVAGSGSFFEVHSNAECRFIAGRLVRLNPGFHAIHGCEFEAKAFDSPQLKSGTLVINPENHDTINIINEMNRTEAEICIYPNPATHHLHIISSNLNRIIGFDIYNTTGTIILSNNPVDNSDITISLDGFNPGVYIIKVFASDKISILKFIKE